MRIGELRSDRAFSATLAALFFLSGACGLVYQIVWLRMLMVVFGTSVHAVSTVLTAFMGGLALGAVWLGRIVDQRSDGLRFYGWLELGIAVCAAAIPLVHAGLDDVYTWAYRALAGVPGAFAGFRFALTVAILLVPTTLMGGTLPALVRQLAGRGHRLGFSTGALYGLNSLGAVAGCILAAFVLIERIGVRATSWSCALLNALVALVALLLSARPAASSERRPAVDTPNAEPTEISARTDPRFARVVVWGYGVSGFAALGLEVTWTRLLAVIQRITTTQSLSTILVVFLFGLGAGSAVGARLVDRWRRLPAAFGLLELLLGLASALSIAAFALVPIIDEALQRVSWGWPGHILRLLATAGVVIGAPTFLMGLLFPVAGKLYARGHATVGRRVGGLYGANTLGAILGAFVTGFVLIPLLGSQRSLTVLALLPLAVGIAAVLADRRTTPRARTVRLAALAAPTLALLVALPATFVAERFRVAPGSELIHHAEGAAGTVTVHRFPDDHRVLRVNGAGEVPTDWDSIRVFRLLGTLPMVLHPDPREVLVVAFGGGITLSAVERQQPDTINVVEIVPEVTGAAHLFADYNGDVLARDAGRRIRLTFDDARNYILRSERSYDVIVSDSTHPSTADSWVLYTEEFYRQCRKRLAARGIMAQWLPIHGLTVEDYRTILRTFQNVFEHATVWYTPGYSVMLATPEPLRVDVERVRSRLERHPSLGELAEVDLADPAALLATLVLDESGVSRYAGTGPTNTDDLPLISFGDRGRSRTHGLFIVASFGPHLFHGGDDWVVGSTAAGVRRALDRRLDARRWTMAAEIARGRREPAQAREAVRRALAAAPDDLAARRLAEQLGGGQVR